jgi:transposase
MRAAGFGIAASRLPLNDYAHRCKAEAVRQRIEACGCRRVFLPRYSPDFNPIEGAFSKLKAFLRQAQARTREALEAAIGAGLQTISAQDAQGWFKHCGYSQKAQPS